MSNDFTASQDCINLVTAFEGCKLTAYPDQGGVWTIGYGHTGPDVYEGLTITQDQAIAFLQQDLQTASSAVNRYVTVDLQQNQFDPLVDFVFNEGAGRLQHSTLLRDLNAGNYSAAADQFLVWDIAAGKVDAGLYRRREAERAMFLGQDWTVYNNGVA